MPNQTISKVLVANRGEIAVRVIRAAKDAGLASVAVYADPDADAPHVTLADEAFALGGQTSADSYLDFGKMHDAGANPGRKANQPGSGLHSENAYLAQARIEPRPTWQGPRTPGRGGRPQGTEAGGWPGRSCPTGSRLGSRGRPPAAASRRTAGRTRRR